MVFDFEIIKKLDFEIIKKLQNLKTCSIPNKILKQLKL